MDRQAAIIAKWREDLPEVLAGRDPVPGAGGSYCSRCTMVFRSDKPQNGVEVSRCAECGRSMANAEASDAVKVWAL